MSETCSACVYVRRLLSRPDLNQIESLPPGGSAVGKCRLVWVYGRNTSGA